MQVFEISGVLVSFGKQVAEVLRQIILRLFDKHLADDGKSVKYGALAEDPDFWLFATATAELQGVDPTPLNREERIAFFLNVYNVLIIHAQVAFGGPSNFFSRSVPLLLLFLLKPPIF